MTSLTAGTQWNYVVTAQKPTIVSHSKVGNFTSETDVNLILARGTRVEIHKIAPEGLEGVLDVPIYGRISLLELFRPPGCTKDVLFLATERYNFCVLEYDTESGELVTRAMGDLRDQVGKPRAYGQIGIIDPECRMIGLQMYKGLFKVIPITPKGLLEGAYNIRMDELVVHSVVFLHGCLTRPTVAVLSEDIQNHRSMKAYEIDTGPNRDFFPPMMDAQHLDPNASLLIAVPKPCCGVLVLGGQNITYLHPTKARKNLRTPTSAIYKSYSIVDGEGKRILLGDHSGNLVLLRLKHEKEQVVGMETELLGRTSIPESISYLDNAVIFVGSCFGDSQLIRIHKHPVAKDPHDYLEVLDSFMNLGSIVDFCVVDLERQGQGQIVTCSGAGKDGSLRVVRNGIGMIEQASIELPGIKGMWSLKAQDMDAFDTYLVLAFVCSTVVLAMAGEELEESSEFEGLDADSQTLFCANAVHEQIIQVTHRGVRLLDETNKRLIAQWAPPGGLQINVVGGNAAQVLLATGEGNVVYLEIEEGALREVQHMQLASEVSCIDITPLDRDSGRAQVAAVGTWKLELQLLELPSLNPLLTEKLPGDVIPRSILCALFEDEPYVLVAMGDGHLITYRLRVGGAVGLGARKVLSLGTKPISLYTFRSQGVMHVFAASDRPTIIYSSNKKLLYSNLNENEVNVMTPFSPSSVQDGLAIAKDGLLTIGNIDEVQKLHVRTIELGMQARRITHQESTRTFLLALENDVETTLSLVDDQTFESLGSHKLQWNEQACTIISTTLSDDPVTYYIVGTATEDPEDESKNRGRILFFHVRDRTLFLVYEQEAKGSPWVITPFQGKLLAGISSAVVIFDWQVATDSTRELVFECSHLGRVFVVSLAARGDFIAVADLMRSIEILHYNPEAKSLSFRARDASPNFMTCVTILDDDTYLGAENSCNLLTVQKNSESATDEERSHLAVVGEFHLGELVNRFHHGSLVVKMADQDALQVNTILYGTINGVIGVIASLPQPLFEYFNRLQDALRKVVKGVGGFEHAAWRTFYSEHGGRTCKGFIDGDLVEQYLELKPESQAKVAAHMGPDTDVEDILRKVEEVSRCCH